MRILITGAAGFLGSHLCDRLLKEGHQVIGMDNFITGSPENLAHLAGHPDFSFIRHDVSNFIFVPGKLDAVMHFASPASPNAKSPFGYVNLPIQTMKAGALGTHNSLGLARANNARSCWHPPVKFMETLWNIRNVKHIGDMSIRLDCVLFMMRPSALLRL